MKKVYLFFIIIVLASFLSWAIWDIAQKPKETKNENLENSAPLSIVSIVQSDSFYNIHIEYPQFKNASAQFNREISKLVSEMLESFKKTAKENWDARRDTATPENPIPENPIVPFDFIVKWAPAQINNRYLSFMMDIYYFTGGAHGSTEIYTFNYDVANQKEIFMNDFLGQDEASLVKIAQIAKQQIEAQLQEKGVNIDDNFKQNFGQGIEPTPENFGSFNFTFNSLIIYFQKYQVAPGAFGPITATIYKDTLLENSLVSNYLK